MILFNTGFLRKHLDDILSDKYLLCNNITDLTEAHLEVGENTADLEVKLEKRFRVRFNRNVQIHRRIGIVYSNIIQLVDSEDRESITILTLSKIKFSLRLVKVALLYRYPKSPVRAFIEHLSWLANVKKVDTLLEDFNINALSNGAYAVVSTHLPNMWCVARFGTICTI